MRMLLRSAEPSTRSSAPGVVRSACLLMLGGLLAGFPTPSSSQAFGGAVLVADGQVLVGESAHEREPGTVRGFTFDGEWTEVWSLHAPEPEVRDGFGRALALSGDHLLVGASGNGNGLVYVYRLSEIRGGGADPVQTLGDSGLTELGASLMTSGSELIATATREGDGRVLATFGRGEDGTWSPTGTVALPEDAGNLFDLGGDLLASTGPGGGVHVFERNADGSWGTPTELARPGAEDGPPVMFGTSVAVAGDEILVGQLTLSPPPQAALNRFAKVDGAWTAVGTLSGDGKRRRLRRVARRRPDHAACGRRRAPFLLRAPGRRLDSNRRLRDCRSG